MEEDDPKPKPSKPTPSDPPQSGLTRLWSELKRRKVKRVAITCGVAAWLMIQVTAIVFPQLNIPDWAACGPFSV